MAETLSNRIVHVIPRPGTDGVPIDVEDFLANLPPGCQHILATGEQGRLCDQAVRRAIHVKLIPSLEGPVSPVHDMMALGGLTHLINSERPALIHAHTSKAAFLSRLAGALTRTPVVFTAHSWSFADSISALQRALAVPLERFSARLPNVVTIWNGIPDTHCRAKPGNRAVHTLIMVAPFARRQEHRELLMALSKVDIPWRLQLVGDGPAKSEVEALSNSLGMQNQVQFLGDRDDVSQLLASADLFVLPTRSEGLPVSILQAMRAGLAVIASDVGGCPEAVTHGLTGFLYAPGDISQLAVHIETLISPDSLLAAMGVGSRMRYEREFRIEKMIQKTLAAYALVAPTPNFVASLQALAAQLGDSRDGLDGPHTRSEISGQKEAQPVK